MEWNQYLIDAATYNYLLTNWHYTDDMQLFTGSAGASYHHGVGRRVIEIGKNRSACRWNVEIPRDFRWSPDVKPVTLRFDIVNLFDTVYELRNGTSIGVFAPQYGARRGFFAGISQKL